MKTLIYDCEIINCIPPKDGNFDPDLKYCQGWRDFENMGISVIGCWTSWQDKIWIFRGNNLSSFQKLVNEAELIVGFNSIAFDDNLCKANGISIKTHYDLLQEVWWAAGMPRQYTYKKTRPGYSLNELAKTNLGKEKSGEGSLAPVDWQQGKYWKVIRYCTDNILITKAIWQKRSRLKDPTFSDRVQNGKYYIEEKFLKLREPWETLETRHEIEIILKGTENIIIPF